MDGHTFYPQDLEATAADASPMVRRGYVAAFSLPANEVPGAPGDVGGQALVIIAERAAGTSRADPQGALEAVRAAVLDKHGVAPMDVRLVPAGAIPRTTSGKLARRACCGEYLDGTLRTR